MAARARGCASSDISVAEISAKLQEEEEKEWELQEGVDEITSSGVDELDDSEDKAGNKILQLEEGHREKALTMFSGKRAAPDDDDDSDDDDEDFENNYGEKKSSKSGKMSDSW